MKKKIQKQKNKTEELGEKYSFVQIPRFWRRDYINGKISYDEYSILLWLAMSANYLNGITTTSYESIASELSGKYSKNQVNKIMRSLKRKQYIWYPEIRGSRRPFEVEIGNYRFSRDKIKNISHRFEPDNKEKDEVGQKSDKGQEEDSQESDKSATDNEQNEQKSETEFNEPICENVWDSDGDSGRTPNNDKNKETHKDNENPNTY